MASVTRLTDVDPSSATEVALVGELRVDAPRRDSDLNVSYAALRTDVGFKIEQYSSTIRRSTPCADAPVGFERVWESPHAGKGPLGRRDTILLPGDRVELHGKVMRGRQGYRERADFRTVGTYQLCDLSLGQLTRAEEQARDRKIMFGLIGGALLAIAIGVMVSVLI